jgi:short-subunit dehydrogenase
MKKRVKKSEVKIVDDRLERKYEIIDVLINNAGISQFDFDNVNILFVSLKKIKIRKFYSFVNRQN